MNYYEHHIGDYAEATSHLTFIEDAAYSRLIRKYYATEKPLPADVRAVQRLVCARTKEERDAVESVLNEFFELREDGWHNERCDEEIARYQAGEPERQLKRDNRESRTRRHREERARLFRALEAVGQFPAWNIPMGELRELHSRFCVTAPETPETLQQALPVTTTATPVTATQTPDTRHQSPVPSPQAPEISKNPPTPQGGADRANARQEGRRPRYVTNASLAAWGRTCEVIDSIRASKDRTWDDADRELRDVLAAQAIRTAGGHKAIADRTQFTQGELKRRFREHYEQQLENRKDAEGEGTSPNGQAHRQIGDAVKGMPQ